MTADGLFVPNELLLQLNSQSENHFNGNSDKIIGQSFHDHIYPDDVLECAKLSKSNECVQPLDSALVTSSTQESQVKELNGIRNELLNISNLDDIGDVIQLLNSEGAVITLNKSVLNSLSVSAQDLNVANTEMNYQDMFEAVTAYKCKFCSLLCESMPDMVTHLKSEHISKVFYILN